MAWIEIHQSLISHRKTMEAAAALDLPEVYVVGHLVALWTWALDNAQDGVLPSSPRLIARVAQWPGDPEQFVNALCSSGFLDGCSSSQISIHDWYEYAGRLIEKREQNKQRMRDKRATHVQCTTDARAGATVPYRTIPNQPEDNPPIAPPSQTRKRAKSQKTSLPGDFTVTDEMRDWAYEKVPQVDIEEATEHWLLWVRKGDEKFVDWPAAWQSGMRMAAKWQKEERNNGNGKRETVAQHNLRVVQQLEREWAAVSAGEIPDNESPYPGGQDGAGRQGIRLIGPGI